MTPGTYNLTVQRNAPFLDSFNFEGFDFTGATFEMEVRAYRGATGAALLAMAGATAGSQGISVTTSVADSITTSAVLIQIDKTTIDGLLPASTNGQKAGTDVVLYYDLKITGGGLPETRWVEGTFTIHEGVTV